MLWKKESSQPDAQYIDIFTPNTQYWDSIINSNLKKIDQTPLPEKSDAIALEKRNEGNQKFLGSTTNEALTLYCDSLRFAKPGSEHISLAYANRAACFLKKKVYDECLIDIEYAITAGYPEHLRPKLNDRKAKCLKEIERQSQHPSAKLTIEPDEKFPCLSKVAKVQRNENGDYLVVAKEDIKVGQVVAIEDACYTYLSHSFGIYCCICAKECGNLVPCEKCAVAMFCPDCRGHSLHEHECGLNFCGESEYNRIVMGLVRRTLLALKSFSTADELMTFVEQMLNRPNELPDNMLDDRSKYHALFNSPVKLNFKSLNQMVPTIYPTYNTLLRIPRVSEMFKTTQHRRFLQHLIGHHATILDSTAGIAHGSPNPLGPPICITPIMRSYIKHSCNANVEFFVAGGKCYWISVKPVKSGEVLCASYAPFEMHSTEERKKYLWDSHKIKCRCSWCQGKVASPAQRQQLLSDPMFHYIDVNVKNAQSWEFDAKQLKPLMDACVTVLQKYGQMDWCEEIDFVSKSFTLFYTVRTIGGDSALKQLTIREYPN